MTPSRGPEGRLYLVTRHRDLRTCRSQARRGITVMRGEVVVSSEAALSVRGWKVFEKSVPVAGCRGKSKRRSPSASLRGRLPASSAWVGFLLLPYRPWKRRQVDSPVEFPRSRFGKYVKFCCNVTCALALDRSVPGIREVRGRVRCVLTG